MGEEGPAFQVKKMEDAMRKRILFLLVAINVGISFWAIPGASDAEEKREALNIDRAVEVAFQDNPDLVGARRALGIFRGELTSAQTFPFNPEIEIESITDRFSGNGGEGGYAVGISQETEIGGQRRLRIQIAKSTLERAEREMENLERVIIGEVKKAFYEVLFLEEKLKFTRQIVQLNQNLVTASEQRLAVGDIPELEVNLARAEFQKLQREQTLVETELLASKGKLNTLLGRQADADLILQGSLSRGGIGLTLDLQELLASALTHRPDLLALRLERRSADVQLTLARRERIPNIRGFIRIERERSVFDDTPIGRLRETDTLATFRLAIPLPFFNRRRGEIDRALAVKEVLAAKLPGVEQQIRREVITAYTRLNSARNGLALFEKGILPQVEDNFERIQRSYQVGRIDIFRTLVEQDRFIRTRLLYLENLFNYNRSATDLESAVGMGRIDSPKR